MRLCYNFLYVEVVIIKCLYCGKQTNKIFKMAHDECLTEINQVICNLDNWFEQLKNQNITPGKSNIVELMELVLGNTYQKYVSLSSFPNLMNPDELGIILVESIVAIEEKNTKSMVRTGTSYRRYPIWEVKNNYLGTCNLLITDKQLYVFQQHAQASLCIRLNKIINSQILEGKIVIEIKTTSLYPRKLYLDVKKTDFKVRDRLKSIIDTLTK